MAARRTAILAMLLVSGALVAGCGLARSRYDAVTLGMSGAKVKEILGAPRYQFADEWVYTQDNPRDLTIVTLRFKEGRLVAKRWENPEEPEEDNREGPAAD